MHYLGLVQPVTRQFLKRHAEALFIIAFILADCFLSGWALTAGTCLAIAYVIVPALGAMLTLSAAERVTFINSFLKTAKFQRLALILFWIYSIRWLLSALAWSHFLDAYHGQLPSISTALIIGTQQFAPVAFLASPIIIYVSACLIAILLRLRMRATKLDPDLVALRQIWCGANHFLFLGAFVGSILSITLNTKGPAYMISNWLLASAIDANIMTSVQPVTTIIGQSDGSSWSSTDTIDAFAPGLPSGSDTFSHLATIQAFDHFVLTSCSLLLFLVLLKPALRLNALLISFCWRVVSPRSLQNLIEAFLEALRLPSRTLVLREKHPFWNNAVRTLVWLVACYSVLFWLFGFCGGPLGDAIQNWMMASALDAGFCNSLSEVPAWVLGPNLRIFLGSIVALYGTAPLAITAPVFLPYAKPRRFFLNGDGLLFEQGPYLSLWGRQFRLWSDLKSMTVKKVERPNGRLTAKFTLLFRSGGHVKFNSSQVSAQDLKVLLEGIDQHASACAIDADVFSVCQTLNDADRGTATSDGIVDTAIASIPAPEFKSTVFVPFSPGECITNTSMRVIKQLASKPLCAVYLAREADGRMVIVKQFYLANESDEVKALTKILTREYELLTGLDHPSIAKVVSCFTIEKSTLLVIEHRLGSDLRAIVKEHGARSESLVVSWAQQLCQVMIYLHGREPAVIHRDLTPDNVIAGEDGQLRLIDFGAAREFLQGVTGTMIGKHCYMAPEQLRGEANPRSDIYSFGCTLYFLLTGRDPVALSQSSPAKNLDCSSELDKLIRDCTELEDEKRPQSFEEVLKRLQALNKGFRLKLPAAKEEAVA